MIWFWFCCRRRLNWLCGFHTFNLRGFVGCHVVLFQLMLRCPLSLDSSAILSLWCLTYASIGVMNSFFLITRLPERPWNLLTPSTRRRSWLVSCPIYLVEQCRQGGKGYFENVEDWRFHYFFGGILSHLKHIDDCIFNYLCDCRFPASSFPLLYLLGNHQLHVWAGIQLVFGKVCRLSFLTTWFRQLQFMDDFFFLITSFGLVFDFQCFCSCF